MQYLDETLNFDVLLVQVVSSAVSGSQRALGVAIYDLTDDFLSVRVEVQVGWALEHIVQEVRIHEHQRILLAVVVYCGPHGDELGLHLVQLMLRLQQVIDDEGWECLGAAALVSRHVLVHELLDARAHLIVAHQFSFLE